MPNKSTSAAPIRIGYCLSLTGLAAGNSRSAQLAHEICRKDVNNRGGLLGRPVELDCYDDHADATLVHSIYERLMDEDRVDLVIGGYGTNTVLSEASAKTIRRAHAVQSVTAVQTEYSLMERSPERNGVLATCEELGIGFVPWGPVGMGYLTGKMDANTRLDPKTDFRSGFDRFSPENLTANMPFVDFLRRFAEKKNATPSQIALAWLMAQKPFNGDISLGRTP